MKKTKTVISPLRQCMIEGMSMLDFKEYTKTDYIRAVKSWLRS